jgi:pimeloyl-ACP methyl ester carboxylesterase
VAWRVTARDGRGHETASPLAGFLAAGTAPAAVPDAPADERVPPLLGATYAWLPMKPGLHAVEVRAAGEATWRRACEGGQQCRDPTPLRPSTTYEWRVAREADDYGAAVSAVETFRTSDPIVLVHGLLSDGGTWAGTVDHLRSEGEAVVDFDAARPGVQALTYAPADPTQGIHATAVRTVAPAIERAMRNEGHPEGTPVTVIAHSMGGLVARSIVQAGADDAFPIERLITLGTPHRGSLVGGVLTAVGPTAIAAACAWVFNVAYRACSVATDLAIDAVLGSWKAAVDDLAPWSAYLMELNAQPERLPYVAVAGTQDLVVSQASATFNAAASLGVAMGHAALTGKACTSPEACSVNLLAVKAARSLLT